MGKPAVRLGDKINCPQKGHGTNPIQSGSPDVFFNGQPAARVGDKTACGDTIIEGNSSILINGKPAAFLGCTTAHGGIIINGSDNILIGTHESEITTVQPENHDYDQHFALVDQEGKPARDYAYSVVTADSIHEGEVCEQGKTTLVSTSSPEHVDLKHAYQTRIGVRK